MLEILLKLFTCLNGLYAITDFYTNYVQVEKEAAEKRAEDARKRDEIFTVPSGEALVQSYNTSGKRNPVKKV